jgi:hypothetical protein
LPVKSSSNYSWPAISREIEFIAHHIDAADAIYDRAIDVEDSLKKLSDAVYERACDDVAELLKELQSSIDAGTKDFLKIKWKRKTDGAWETDGMIYMARGRKKGIGSIGIHLGYGEKLALKLIGWIYPKGGLDGRRQFAQRYNKKGISKVHLISDDANRYPGWSSDGVIWFTEDLSIRTSRDHLCSVIEKQAKLFFRRAKPLLIELR